MAAEDKFYRVVGLDAALRTSRTQAPTAEEPTRLSFDERLRGVTVLDDSALVRRTDGTEGWVARLEIVEDAPRLAEAGEATAEETVEVRTMRRRAAAFADEDGAVAWARLALGDVDLADGAARVLAFWFGAAYYGEDGAARRSRAYAEARFGLWFGRKSPWFDAAQCQATALVDAIGRGAITGETPGWEGPLGTLARVVVLDQFGRLAHKGDAEAYRYDDVVEREAASLTTFCCCCGSSKTDPNPTPPTTRGTTTVVLGYPWAFDAILGPLEQFVVTLALSHAERAETQAAHVMLARRLQTSAEDADLAKFFAELPGYPLEHYECVRRFGRFPHRNACLGRPSAPAETEWLASEAPPWARPTTPKYALVYWHGGRGLAEPCRYVLAACRVPFVDVGVRTRDEWRALRDSGRLPFDKLPVLVEGLDLAAPISVAALVAALEKKKEDTKLTVLAETGAICRHVARRAGLLASETPERSDALHDALVETRRALYTARFRHAAARSIFLAHEWPRAVARLERFVRDVAEPKPTRASGRPDWRPEALARDAPEDGPPLRRRRLGDDAAAADVSSSSSASATPDVVRFLAGGRAPTYVDVLCLEFVDFVQDDCYDDAQPDAAWTYLRARAPTLHAILAKVKALPQMRHHYRTQRAPPPDDDYVRRVCATLDLPLPSYLAEDAAESAAGPPPPEDSAAS